MLSIAQTNLTAKSIFCMKKIHEQKDNKEVNPQLVEEAVMEIIEHAEQILQDYGLKGAVTNIELGFGKYPNVDTQKYNVQPIFPTEKNEGFAFTVNFKRKVNVFKSS